MHRLRIHDYRGVAMPFVQGELIHDQAAYAASFELPMPGLQAKPVDLLDGVPV